MDNAQEADMQRTRAGSFVRWDAQGRILRDVILRKRRCRRLLNTSKCHPRAHNTTKSNAILHRVTAKAGGGCMLLKAPPRFKRTCATLRGGHVSGQIPTRGEVPANELPRQTTHCLSFISPDIAAKPAADECVNVRIWAKQRIAFQGKPWTSKSDGTAQRDLLIGNLWRMSNAAVMIGAIGTVAFSTRIELSHVA